MPEDVAFLFESARGAMIYGQYFRVLEAGVRHRCRQLGLGRKKSDPADAFSSKPYLDLVEALHKNGKIPPEDLEVWKTMVTLRNTFSHRTRASVRPRHQAIEQFAYIAELLNRLFK